MKKMKSEILQTIQEIKKAMNRSKEFIKADWNFRDMYGGNISFRQEMKEFRKRIFLLRAAEKQIPMPPKVYKTCSATEIWPGHKEIIWDVWLECQKCGEKYTPYCGDEKVKYCPHCGQKLWWPKN